MKSTFQIKVVYVDNNFFFTCTYVIKNHNILSAYLYEYIIFAHPESWFFAIKTSVSRNFTDLLKINSLKYHPSLVDIDHENGSRRLCDDRNVGMFLVVQKFRLETVAGIHVHVPILSSEVI